MILIIEDYDPSKINSQFKQNILSYYDLSNNEYHCN